MAKTTEEELKNSTVKMALQHVKISKGETPEDESELDDQLDDMWYNFAQPDYENNPAYEGMKIQELITKLHLQNLYKSTAKEAFIKKYKLSF